MNEDARRHDHIERRTILNLIQYLNFLNPYSNTNPNPNPDPNSNPNP